MTLTMTRPSEPRAVGPILASIHESWVQHLRSVLLPATDPEADLWSRWGIARFLADQFGDRFRLETAFALAIEGLISREAATRLAAARQEIERTMKELMAEARRKDASDLTAALARRLMEEVAYWCVELELATAQLTTELPGGARRLLGRLRIAHAAGR